MNREIMEVIDELLSLAREQNWPTVVSGVEALKSSDVSQQVTVVAPTEADSASFVVWIRDKSTHLELNATIFADIDLRTRVSPHLIGYFPGDRLIEAAEVETIANDFFTRPVGSYAIVIGVNSLQSPEDLKMVERTAWRLFVANPPSNWAHADLKDFGVYLWGDGVQAEFLSQLMEPEKQALAAWLRGPGADSDALVAREAIGYLQVGEDLHRTQAAKRLSSQAASTKELAAAMDNITDFRARLNRRLDGDAELLVAEVTGKMRDWSSRLRDSIQSSLVDAFGNGRTIPPETAQAIVEKKLRGASPVWAEGITTVIRTQRNELRRDSEGLFEIINWNIVNDVARQSGLHTTYPEALLEQALAGNDPFDQHISNSVSSGAPKQRESPFSRNLVMIGLPVTAGVGTIASWMMHFPIGIPIGIVAGLIGTLAATKQSGAGCDLAQCSDFASEAVQHFLNRAVSHFQGETQMVAARFRRCVGEGFRKLDDLLGTAVRDSYRATGGPDDQNTTEAIQRLKVRLLALCS